jgi:hypothetical protein
MNSPKRLIVEYEDGSEKVAEFGQLSDGTRLELSRLGLCPPPPGKISDYYALMQWKDGWQEVVGISKRAADLLRYYTIERSEEIGRMALDVAEEYPLLLLVKRLPGRIDRIMLVGRMEVKGYALQQRRTAKEGGKVERIFYDSKTPCLTEDARGWMAGTEDQFRVELKKRSLTAEQLLSLDDPRKFEACFGIAAALGIRGMERQEDVYGFILRLAENLPASKQ